MKPLAAIVESDLDRMMVEFRASYSKLRELDVQSAKAEKRVEDATRIASSFRARVEEQRIETAKRLAVIHEAMGVKQGDRSGRWARFLRDEGINEETARRWIREVGSHDAASLPTPRGKSTTANETRPDPPRKPFGKLLDMQLLLGTWQDMLGDIGQVDSLITDPPYSERVHKSAPTRDDGSDPEGLSPNYEPWTAAHVKDFVEHWSPRVRGWMLCLCDDELIPAYRHAYERMGRVVFAPVPCVITGMSVRTRGDGPSSWAVYAMVARPASGEFARWGTLDGAYVGPRVEGSKHGRGKPPWLTDYFVRDYTRGNDLVCDPLAGYGGTLVSAIRQGRRAIGAEQDPKAVEEAFARVERGEASRTAATPHNRSNGNEQEDQDQEDDVHEEARQRQRCEEGRAAPHAGH